MALKLNCMQEVSVKLKNSSKVVEFNLNFPNKWNELTPNQLLFVAKHWQGWQTVLKLGEPLLKIRALIVVTLCGLKNKQQRAKLCETLAFVDEDSGGNILSCSDFIFTQLDLTKNILPVVKPGWLKKYVGPTDRLGDISIDEFSFAFGVYGQYQKTNNETLLTTLFAVLYRPAAYDYKKTGDNRLPFNNKLIELYEKDLKKMDDSYRQAVYLFFTGCLEYLAKRFPNVFKRAEGSSKGGSFFDTVVSMSGGKFGPFESTKKTNLYIILNELDIVIYNNANKK